MKMLKLTTGKEILINPRAVNYVEQVVHPPQLAQSRVTFDNGQQVFVLHSLEELKGLFA